MKSRDPTPKKVKYTKSEPMSDRSWLGVKTFFNVGSLKSRDQTLKKVLKAKPGPTSDRGWGGVKIFFGVKSSNLKATNLE